MTNREYLSKLSNEELGEWLGSIITGCGTQSCRGCVIGDDLLDGDCSANFSDWLGSPKLSQLDVCPFL